MIKLRQLREAKGLNMRETAKLLGMPYTTYVNYEKGLREPSSEVLISLADFFGVSTDELLGLETWYLQKSKPMSRAEKDSYIKLFSKAIGATYPLPEMKKIPVIGAIACGAPILAEEHIEDYVDLPGHIQADFALVCKGDSMINARIFDGDIVYIRHQDTVDSGQIAAVLIDNEATLKRVRLFADHIVLEPENPMYKPLSYWGEEMNNVRILGKAVAFTSTIK